MACLAVGFERGERPARRLLLGFLLREPLAFRNRLAPDHALHAEALAVPRPLLFHDHVVGHRVAARLQALLQRALVIGAAAGRLLQVARELVAHEAMRLLDPAVKVERGDHGLVGVGPERLLLAASAALLAAAQQQELGQPQLAGALRQALRRHQQRPRLALGALVALGLAPVQQVRDHEAEHRIAQELERLVVAQLARGVLVGAAGVRERAVEQADVLEAVAEPVFQGPEQGLALRGHRSRESSALSYTTRPPTSVRSTGVFRISRGGTRNKSAPNTTRSASFPGSSVPLRASANSAKAEPRV